MRIRSASKKLLLAAAVAAAMLIVLPDLPQVFAQSSDSNSAPTKAASGKISFDVASIKPVDKQADALIGVNVYPGGRVVVPFVTLKSLICTAFDISSWQVSGGKDWTDKARFNIEAKAPSSSSGINLRHSLFRIEDPNLRLMLQSLLIDRFQLKFHTEMKTGKVYLLQKNGKALPLQPAKTDKLFQNYGDGFSEASVQPGGWFLANASMSQVAEFLSTYVLNAPVLDKTGLTGTFDFRSKSQPDIKEDSGAAALAGLAELGLKLKPQKGPVEYFVIDHAEQPSPN